MEHAEYAVGISRWILRVVGVWPEFNCTKTRIVLSKCIFTSSIICIVIFIGIPQGLKLFMVGTDLDAISDILITGEIPVVVAILKMSIIRYKSGVVESLLRQIYKDWQTPRDANEHAIMLRSAKKGRQIAATCIAVAYVTSFVFLILKLYLIRDKQAKTGKRSLVFESYFPFEVDTTPIFEITWLTQGVFAFPTTTAYSGVDSFFAVLVLHLCGQLEILDYKVKNLVRLDEKNCYFERDYKSIVQRHVQLNRFASRIEEIFNRMFLAQVVACLGLFCLQGFQIMLIALDESVDLPILKLVFLMMFVVYMMLDLYIYCLVAEKLQKTSTEIAYSAYDCHWYNLSSKQAMQLWFIIKRAQKPLEITVGKFSALSYGLFTTIVKTSMGFLSMLLAVKEKIK